MIYENFEVRHVSEVFGSLCLGHQAFTLLRVCPIYLKAYVTHVIYLWVSVQSERSLKSQMVCVTSVGPRYLGFIFSSDSYWICENLSQGLSLIYLGFLFQGWSPSILWGSRSQGLSYLAVYISGVNLGFFPRSESEVFGVFFWVWVFQILWWFVLHGLILRYLGDLCSGCELSEFFEDMCSNGWVFINWRT